MDEKLEQIKDILLEHKGKDNPITSNEIAEKINIERGKSSIRIRELITKTMIKYRLPLASVSKGYYVLNDADDLNRYMISLDGRINEIEGRKARVKVYFEDYFEISPVLDNEENDDF